MGITTSSTSLCDVCLIIMRMITTMRGTHEDDLSPKIREERFINDDDDDDDVSFTGTPATISQLAKDVCIFLKWAAGKSSKLLRTVPTYTEVFLCGL